MNAHKTFQMSVITDEHARDLQVADPTLTHRDPPAYGVWALKGKEGVITAYKSGKILVQGAEGWIMEMEKVLDGGSTDVKEVDSEEFIPRIGTDEVGKGDFFGPLVVAGTFVENSIMAGDLRDAGVRDSKKMSDSEISIVAKKIHEIVTYSHIHVITPKEYNEEYKKVRNANVLLARGHSEVIDELLANADSICDNSTETSACPLIVVDQFSKNKQRLLNEMSEEARNKSIRQMHNGESDVAVAAGSIIARAQFLKEMERMGKEYGMEFPKGASNVIDTGKEFVKKHGVEALDNVAKTSFKTALQVTGTFDL